MTAAKKGQRRKKNKKRNKKNRQSREILVENKEKQILNNNLEKWRFHNVNYSIHDPSNMKMQTGRWKRDEEPAPVYSSEHRIAWLCGDPSMNLL